jgi:hypothetical protein
LAEGEAAHPANYRGCSHVKEEMQKKTQENPKTAPGMAFSSNVTPAAALQGTPEQNKRNNLRHEEVPGTNKHEGT